MKSAIFATCCLAVAAMPAYAQSDVKIGFVTTFSGPASAAPPVASSVIRGWCNRQHGSLWSCQVQVRILTPELAGCSRPTPSMRHFQGGEG